MTNVAQLSTDKCILLAVHYASESNIDALYALTPARSDALSPELILRILLTYLPETVDPSAYISYLREVATRLYLEQRVDVSVDTSPVDEISDAQARKRVERLHLLPLAHPSCPADISKDILTTFLIHRAYRIDTQTGLLNLVPQLTVPFLEQSEFLRTWYISRVLPLLRFGYEYYPENDSMLTLETFTKWKGAKAVETLLSKCQETTDGSTETGNVGRDLRGLVGPWMYGHNERKRRKLNSGPSRISYEMDGQQARRLSLSRNESELDLGHEWEHVFIWLVYQARERFNLVAEAFENWDGPSDIDLGGYADEDRSLDDEEQWKLRQRYGQSGYASVYAAETDEPKTLENAHAILVRLAELLDFEPPPDLATSIELLPKLDAHASGLFDSSASVLQPDMLLQPNHPLTTPKVETFSLMQMFVYSAYQLSGLGHHVAIVKTAKIRFQDDEDEQLNMVQKILHSLSTKSITDDEQWKSIRNKLLWLWNWGMSAEDEPAQYGAGIFGKVDRFALEKEILKTLLQVGRYSLVLETYVKDPDHRLPIPETEEVILATIVHFYDNASNGNKTRGGMKRASDILSTFRPHFPESSGFRRCQALLAATHALSFYSLTLQHGVPFQPVDIRVSNDPVSLIKKVLDQNSNSYTKLDDLISIGQNLVASGITEMKQDCPIIDSSPEDVEQQKRAAERRIIGMAIEAALAEDDFETAYSYVVNRLNPPSPSGSLAPQTPGSGPSSRRPSIPSTTLSYRRQKDEDDISWRAALQAGRYRSPNVSLSSSNTSISSTSPRDLRRLEMRMELLSQALLLAPPNALPEVLAVWRRCEEEMTTLLQQEAEEEERFNDRADRRIPGGFGFEDASVPVVQPRREMGRGAVEEAPMGLFDVARGAAAAFGRSAFPLRGAVRDAAQEGHARDLSSAGSETGSISAGSDGEGQRVRKRDLVANAVTGSLASGLGWVLGATPVQDQRSASR